MKIIYSCFFLFLLGSTWGACRKKTNELIPTVELIQAPTINIVVDAEISKDEKIPMFFVVQENGTWNTYEGRIERRGGFSISFPKHSYAIDLKGDASLFGLPEDDDWVLNANYIDKTFLRHTFSYALFRSMHPNNIAPQTAYCNVHLNEVYNGLYVLMEKLDKSSLQLKPDETTVVFKEPPIFRADIEIFVPQDADNFHQQTYPKIENENKSAFIENLRTIIIDTPDSEFRDEITSHFDLENIMDWHIILLVSNNSDGILKNFYLYKQDAETPVRIAPWDYDHSYGRDGDNELNLITPLDPNRSILINRLMEHAWYREALKAKWIAYNQNGLLSLEGLKTRMFDMHRTFEHLIVQNFERWSVDNAWYYDDNTHEEEIDIFEEYLDVRHPQLVDFFSTL